MKLPTEGKTRADVMASLERSMPSWCAIRSVIRSMVCTASVTRNEQR